MLGYWLHQAAAEVLELLVTLLQSPASCFQHSCPPLHSALFLHSILPQFLHPSLYAPSAAEHTQAASPALKPCQQLGAEWDLALRPENQLLNLAAAWHNQSLSLQGLGTAERRYGGEELSESISSLWTTSSSYRAWSAQQQQVLLT